MLGGTLGFAVWQWSMMLFAAHLSGGADAVGRLSVALAISTPAFLLLGMSLRQVAAADVAGTHSTVEYYLLRLASVFSAILFNLILSLTVMGEDEWWLVTCVSILKSVEALADISYGTMQRAGQTSSAGKSQLLKSLTQAVLFGAVMLCGTPLALSLLLVALASLLMHVVLDITELRQGIAVIRAGAVRWGTLQGCALLAQSAIQSGVAATLIAIATGWPRYVLQQQIDSASAGVFTAAMWVFIPGHILSNALCQSLLHRAAAASKADRHSAFATYVVWFGLGSAAFATLPLVMFLVTGFELPAVLFGTDFMIGAQLLVWATVANVAVGVSSGLNYGIAAKQNFRGQLLAALGAAIACLLTTSILVSSMRLEGAFVASFVTAVVQACLTTVFLFSRAPHGAMKVA